MGSDARQILDEALRLPPEERADIAAELLRSLDKEDQLLAPDEVEQRWAETVTRRAKRAVCGEAAGRDANEVLNSIESKLRQR